MFRKRIITPAVSFEELKQDSWTPQETENAKVVADFLQRMMNEHDFDETLQTFGGGRYLQHNRGIPDGISGVVAYLKNLTKRFPQYSYDVKRINADGDFIIVHSHATLRASHRGNEKKGFIITDTFRLKDGKLAEHWDAIQPIDFFARAIVFLTGGTIANDNPTF